MRKLQLKKSKLFISLTSIVSLVSFGSVIAIPLMGNKFFNVEDYNSYLDSKNTFDENNDLDSNLSDVLNNDKSEVKPLVPSVSNFENAKLSTKQGPIVFWGDTIKSLDWFGAERWSVDLTKLDVKNGDGEKVFPTTYGTDVKRSWMNWELDRKNNKIWIVSNIAAPKNNWIDGNAEFKHQYLISLSTETGKLLENYRLNRVNGRNDVYRNVSIFYDGTPFVYGLGFSIHRSWSGSQRGYSFLGEKLDINQNKMVNISNENIAKKFNVINQENLSGMDYFFNVIPIGNNRNLFFTVERANIRSSTNQVFDNDLPFKQTTVSGVDLSKRDMSITAILLDNDLKEVPGSSQWSSGNLVKIIESASNTFKNKYTFPQRDWYTLLDGRVVTIIYDTLLIFDPTDLNNPTFTSFKIGNDGDWVESYTFDTDENIFYKLYNSPKIEKLTLDKVKNSSKHTKTTYYDLSNSSGDIQKNAKNFSIYNVTGYSGQIMIINSYFDGYNSSKDLPSDPNTDKYGLAAAITNHKTSLGQGDTKGLLNTENAFQQSANFSIKENVLNNKLPSEVTRDDLNLLNNSFFTNRNDKNDNGTLKYEPFLKTKMDDKTKELEIIVNLDQIPWFVTNNQMPNDIKPLTIKKSFNSIIDIDSKFIWKQSHIDDYDFKNTLPSKLKLEDINRISPLISTISSQRTRIDGINYPRTNYSIKSPNDTDGTVIIEAEYEYLPMDTKNLKSNVKKYKLEHKYEIFKSSSPKRFKFVGSNNNNEDISSIPALKELKEANLFPSYFNDASKQDFLKFINVSETAGYPLEKMKITVSANDNNGTLSITVDPKEYDNTLNLTTKTYTGLNKISSYSFSFKEPTTSEFNKNNYRPSDITNEHIFSHFVKYSGFDSVDLDVKLFPNNSNGSLIVNVYVNSSYPKNVLENNGFGMKDGKYIITKTLTSFKNDETFNKEYQLIYKDSSSEELLRFKEFTPAFIKENLENKKLIIGNKTYTDKYEFANEFILSYGSKLKPVDSKTNINVEMFYNNSGGEITFNITYSKLDGYPNPITFIQKFSGFAKGNDIVTADVLTFKDASQLKATNPEYSKMKPSDIEKLLMNNKSKVLDFILGKPTGSYEKAISSNKFELVISADDNYGNLTINIIFKREDITDQKSLLEYSQTFSGLNHY